MLFTKVTKKDLAISPNTRSHVLEEFEVWTSLARLSE